MTQRNKIVVKQSLLKSFFAHNNQEATKPKEEKRKGKKGVKKDVTGDFLIGKVSEKIWREAINHVTTDESGPSQASVKS